MATKQAKLSLGLDLGIFKRGIKEAKKDLEGLGGVSVQTGGAQGGGGRDGSGGGGSGGGGRGAISRGLSLARSPLGMLGMGVTAGAIISNSISRQVEEGRMRMEMRGLSGAVPGKDSRYGFDVRERYERGTQIAGAAGRDLSGKEMDRFVDESEKMQRAFGIQGEAYSGAVGAARKAGITVEDKFISATIGEAVAAGMSGSAVGEYLSEMTGYLSSMSKGIDIDDTSLRGMAGALGQMDFFKKDPSRIFDALRGIEAAFRDSDPYSQYLSYKSLAASDSGISPAGIEMRRKMPLFGKGNEEASRELRAAGLGGIADVFDVSGKDMMTNRVIESYRASKFQSNTAASDQPQKGMQFAEGLGLDMGQAAPFLAKIHQWKQSGKDEGQFKFSDTDINKLEEAMKSPEDKRADANMKFEKGVISLMAAVDRFKSSISDFVTDGVMKFVRAVQDLLEPIGGISGALKLFTDGLREIAEFFGFKDLEKVKREYGPGANEKLKEFEQEAERRGIKPTDAQRKRYLTEEAGPRYTLGFGGLQQGGRVPHTTDANGKMTAVETPGLFETIGSMFGRKKSDLEKKTEETKRNLDSVLGKQAEPSPFDRSSNERADKLLEANTEMMQRMTATLERWARSSNGYRLNQGKV